MRDKNRPVAICARSDGAFARAHSWTVTLGRPAVLLTRADWRLLEALRAALGDFDVLSDDPADPLLAPFRPLSIDTLPIAKEPPPSSQWPDPLALLLTSGSTGEPKTVIKTPAAILGEAHAVRSALGEELSGKTFVSTVPLEHMFGYAFAFWLPRLAGAHLHPARVTLGNDLKALSLATSSPLWIVTTPTHLRGYAELKLRMGNVAGVLCATSPLSSALAREAAQCFGVPITEIYGSTETGAMAIRRRYRDEETDPFWTPLPGVEIRPTPDGAAEFAAPYLEAPVALADDIAFEKSGFTILGRKGDLVKVCGKRHSLQALEHILCSIPGVRDGAYFFPPQEARPELARPAAFVVLEPDISPQGVLEQLRGLVDEVFLPRPLHQVETLPRGENGKLRRADLGELHRICVPAKHKPQAAPIKPVIPVGETQC